MIQESNITTNSSTTPISWPGGEGVIQAQGAFGGGTLTAQFSIDGGTTWTAIGSDTTLTASGGGIIKLSAESQVRLTLTGATSPNIKAVIQSDKE